MYNITSFNRIKSYVLFVLIMLISGFGITNAQQTVDVLIPNGGFEIDGDLEEGTLVGDFGGDWVDFVPPSTYGYTF